MLSGTLNPRPIVICIKHTLTVAVFSFISVKHLQVTTMKPEYRTMLLMSHAVVSDKYIISEIFAKHG